MSAQAVPETSDTPAKSDSSAEEQPIVATPALDSSTKATSIEQSSQKQQQQSRQYHYAPSPMLQAYLSNRDDWLTYWMSARTKEEGTEK